MARNTPVNQGFTIVNGTTTGKNAAFVDVWLEYKVTDQSAVDNTSGLELYVPALHYLPYHAGDVSHCFDRRR